MLCSNNLILLCLCLYVVPIFYIMQVSKLFDCADCADSADCTDCIDWLVLFYI